MAIRSVLASRYRQGLVQPVTQNMFQSGTSITGALQPSLDLVRACRNDKVNLRLGFIFRVRNVSWSWAVMQDDD